MGTWVHFSRSLPAILWGKRWVGGKVLSGPSAAEGGGRRPAFTGLATQPYSATEVDGWQHKTQPGVSKPGSSTLLNLATRTDLHHSRAKPLGPLEIARRAIPANTSRPIFLPAQESESDRSGAMD